MPKPLQIIYHLSLNFIVGVTTFDSFCRLKHEDVDVEMSSAEQKFP